MRELIKENRLKRFHSTKTKKYNLPVRYGSLSSQQRAEVREQYIEEQNGKCMYCKKSLKTSPSKKVRSKKINWNIFPKNFTKYPVDLQHNHDTNLTEGAVHALCNAVLWQYESR